MGETACMCMEGMRHAQTESGGEDPHIWESKKNLIQVMAVELSLKVREGVHSRHRASQYRGIVLENDGVSMVKPETWVK